jgi:hypothetical protein
LTDVFVKGNRQTACGIIAPAKSIRDGRAAFLAGIPCFEYGISVLVDPVNRQRAAVHEHDNQRLASHGHSLNQSLLRFGKIDAGAVSAEKPGLAHRHFFAFQFTGDTNRGNHDIGISGRCHSFR